MQPAEGQSRSLRDYHMIRNTKWDLVIGSDLVYNDMGVEWLPRVALGCPWPFAYLAFLDGEREAWRVACRKCI